MNEHRNYTEITQKFNGFHAGKRMKISQDETISFVDLVNKQHLWVACKKQVT